MAGTSGLGFEFQATAGAIDTSDIIHSFDHGKSSSISHSINGKLRILQNFLKINFCV